VVNNGAPVGRPLYDGHRALWLQELDAGTLRLVGERRVIVNGGTDLSKRPIWIEGPHIFKVGGTYYLSAAEGGTSTDHSQVVFRARSVWGPWEPYSGNPILTQRHLPANRPFPVTSTGHADQVETQHGEWWEVFLGTRPYQGNYFQTGRETFLLPVQWRDGWPVILSGDATVPYAVRRPNLPADPTPPVPLSGNFTLRDEFEGPELQPLWQFVRTPRERWYRLHDGVLTLVARPAALGDVSAQPSFVARRQQHARAAVTTSLSYLPVREGDRAGLAAFYDDAHYLLLSVTRRGAGAVVELESRAGREQAAAVVASSPLRLPASGTVFLQVQVRDGRCSFRFAEREGEWRSLAADVDCRQLSTETAGGFVGAMFGLYAYSAGE
jgi:alpha-N-arabinofuranosidase